MARTTLSSLLSKHIRPEHKVLCVGAFDSPKADPSPLFALTLVGRGLGEVHIVDSQSHSLGFRLIRHSLKSQLSPREAALQNRISELPVGGVGDVREYKRYIIKLRQLGLEVKLPKTRVANAVNTNYGEKQFDVLLDVGSLHDIIKSRVAGGEVPIELASVLREYTRIAKKLIFVSSLTSRTPRIEKLQEALVAAGARVRTVDVKNRYWLKLPPDCEEYIKPVARAPGGRIGLSHIYKYDKAIIAEF